MTPAIDLNQPDAALHAGADLERANDGLVRRLADLPRVTDKASLAQAVLDRQDLADRVAAVEAYFKPIKAMAYTLWQTLCTRERALLDPLRALDRHKAADIREYHDAAIRETRRLEQEAADAQRRDREANAAAEAARFEQAGDPELAAAIVDDAIATPAPVIALPDPTAGIVSFTRRWHWKYNGGPMTVKDTPPDVLRRAIAKLPIEFLTADEKKIGAYVRSMKGSGAIPGVDIFYIDEPNR